MTDDGMGDKEGNKYRSFVICRSGDRDRHVAEQALSRIEPAEVDRDRERVPECIVFLDCTLDRARRGGPR